MTPRIALLALSLAGPFASAQENAPAKLEELDRKIGILTQELERLKLGSAAEEPEALAPALGLGPAAAKVYGKAPRRVSIGGYGELLYENFRGRRQDGAVAAKTDQLDMLRAVVYFGYKFSDRVAFNSELEFEHATESKRGEVSLEMATLDFRLHPALGLRAGLLLMPVGLVNEMHEPTTFHGAKRPSVETAVYPTTWRENGIGIFGEWGPLSYRSYLVTGLQAAKDAAVKGFSASTGLRDGRSSGSKSKAEDLAWVGRMDVSPFVGVSLGASVYNGQADQQMVAASIPVSLWDLHGTAHWRGLEFKALYAQGRVGNADVLNIHQGNAAGKSGSVGSRLFGGYLEAAFDLLSLRPGSGHYLAPFFRYERYDTQRKVPDGWLKDGSNSRLEWTLGLSYKPIPQAVAKFDHQILKNQGLTGIGQTNLAVGYIF